MSEGKFSKFEDIIYYDATDRPAVVYSDQKVQELVRLRTNVDDLPSNAVKIEIGEDMEAYYAFYYSIEVTYQSGSTKYELLCKGK